MEINLNTLQRLSGNASATILYHYLITIFENTQNTELEKNEMWFKCPFGELQDKLSMKQFKVRSALKTLANNNLILQKNKGLPQTMWIKILYYPN